MEECIKDSEGTNGLVVVSGKKNMPWLTPKKFYHKFGFETCDEAPPAFELLVKKNKKDAPDPRFRDVVRSGTIDDKEGVVIMYSQQCPCPNGQFLSYEIMTARRFEKELRQRMD